MPWSADYSDVPRDRSLDLFRDSIGHLVLHDHPVGFIATRVSALGTRESGRLWWATWSVQEFVMVYVTSTRSGSGLPEFDDPWLIPDSHDEAIASLREGRWEETDFSHPDRVGVEYEVRWLDGPERHAAWAAHGFDRTDEGPGPVPPIVCVDGGDVTLYSGFEAAERQTEVYDLDVLDFYDAAGLRLVARPARDHGVRLAVAEPREHDPGGLATVLRAFVRAVGTERVGVADPDHEDLDSLVSVVAAFQGVEQP